MIKQRGVVVELGLRFTPGAREILGSNPSDPILNIRPLFWFYINLILQRRKLELKTANQMIWTIELFSKYNLKQIKIIFYNLLLKKREKFTGDIANRTRVQFQISTDLDKMGLWNQAYCC